jgi:hypothetical protein
VCKQYVSPSDDGATSFQSSMIVRDRNDDPATEVMQFTNTGNVYIEGFVNVEGDMTLGGNVGGFLPAELVNGLPSLFKESLWSWRECYDPACS